MKVHNIILEGRTSKGLNIKLRPMTQRDFPLLEKWNADPEILYYSEGENVISYTPSEVRKIYTSVCKDSFCFIIEAVGVPVGECWLQRMNLERIIKKYPKADCRRIDLMIGEKKYWNKGIGTEVVRILTEFGFMREKADMIFACDIADFNIASIKIFQKNGYKIHEKIKEPKGSKSAYVYDMFITREEFFKRIMR